MAILKSHEREYVENVFRLVENEVILSFFTKQPENQAGRETQEILDEIASISDMIKFKVYDFEKDKTEVEKYKIDKIPAIVVEGIKDFECIDGFNKIIMFFSFVESIINKRIQNQY